MKKLRYIALMLALSACGPGVSNIGGTYAFDPEGFCGSEGVSARLIASKIHDGMSKEKVIAEARMGGIYGQTPKFVEAVYAAMKGQKLHPTYKETLAWGRIGSQTVEVTGPTKGNLSGQLDSTSAIYEKFRDDCLKYGPVDKR